MSKTNIRLLNGKPDFIAASRPQDRDIEKLIISCFISMGRVAVKRYHGIIKEDYFTDTVYKRVYRVIEQMYEEGLEIEPGLLVTRLHEIPSWKELDAADDRLNLLLDDDVKLDNVDNYYEILTEKYRLRKLQNIISKCWQRVNHDVTRIVSDDNTAKIAGELISKIKEISKEGAIKSGESLGEVALRRKEYREKITALQQRYTGVTSGITQLDEMTLGFQPGDLIVIGARPSIGKTGATLSLLRAAEKYNPENLVIFQTNEMTTDAITDRWLSQVTNISMARLRAPAYLSAEEKQYLNKATESFENSNVILNGERIDSDQMVMSWYRHADKHGKITAIGVDYIQLIARREEYKHNYNLRSAVSAICVKFKDAALELKCPIFLLSQVKREVEDRDNKRPTMSDLSESAALESDADIVMCLYRDNYYNPEAAPDRMELIVEKHKNGPVGMVPAGWNRTCASLFDLKTKQSSFVNSLENEIRQKTRNNSE